MSDALEQTQNLEELIPAGGRGYRSSPDPMGAAANDLANLLAAMKGQAQLACDDPTEEEKDELVRVVLSATLKAEGILRRLHEAPAAGSAVRPTAKGLKEAKPAHILVADDEETVRMLMERVLGKCGYQVTTADSGGAALALIRDHAFDLALLDVQLGDMKGTDLYRLMAPHCPETHVIFMSGDPDIADEFGTSPARKGDVFIRKPFDVNEVRQRVGHVLALRAALS
jgi:CheY-like chemotaxis protein